VQRGWRKRERREEVLNIEEKELCNRVFEIPNLPYGLGSIATRGQITFSMWHYCFGPIKLKPIRPFGTGFSLTEAKTHILLRVWGEPG